MTADAELTAAARDLIAHLAREPSAYDAGDSVAAYAERVRSWTVYRLAIRPLRLEELIDDWYADDPLGGGTPAPVRPSAAQLSSVLFGLLERGLVRWRRDGDELVFEGVEMPEP
jgi:hypothetical protein